MAGRGKEGGGQGRTDAATRADGPRGWAGGGGAGGRPPTRQTRHGHPHCGVRGCYCCAAMSIPTPVAGRDGTELRRAGSPPPYLLAISLRGGRSGWGGRHTSARHPAPPSPPLPLPLPGAPPVTLAGRAARRGHLPTRRPTRCSDTSGAAVADETPQTPRLGRRATPRAWPPGGRGGGPPPRGLDADAPRGSALALVHPRSLPAPLRRRWGCDGPVPVARSPSRPPRSPHSQTNRAGRPAGHGPRRPPIGADGAPHGAAAPPAPLTAAASRRQRFKPRRQLCDTVAASPTPPAGVAETPPSSPPVPPPPQPMPPAPNQRHIPQPPPGSGDDL